MSKLAVRSAIAVSMAANPAIAAAKAPVSLSVLTYNVQGMPWPIVRGRPAAFEAMATKLRAMRQSGTQPHVIVLQEAFTPDAKQIGRRAGYRYIVDGPSVDQRDKTAMTLADRAFARGASWWKGERTGKVVDSGLQILSDYPIVAVKRAAFPNFACAGFDCLANKGVLLAIIKVPGRDRPVAVATVHLNSRKASGVGSARSFYAYRRQSDALFEFLARNRRPDLPLILAGDFNVGRAQDRRGQLSAKLASLWGAGTLQRSDALAHCVAKDRIVRTERHEALEVLRRAKDWQFALATGSGAIVPATFAVPFGRGGSAGMLSDHMGYMIRYRLL